LFQFDRQEKAALVPVLKTEFDKPGNKFLRDLSSCGIFLAQTFQAFFSEKAGGSI
jgi:hypothetical protein